MLTGSNFEIAFGFTIINVIADITLKLINQVWVEHFPIQFKPKLYKRYVDYIFVMFDSRDHVKKFVDYIDTKLPNIQFIFPTEDQNSYKRYKIDNINVMRNTEKKILKYQFIEKVHSVVILLISRGLFLWHIKLGC